MFNYIVMNTMYKWYKGANVRAWIHIKGVAGAYRTG